MADPLVSLDRVNQALALDLMGAAPDYADDPRTDDILAKIEEATDIVLDYVTEKPEGGWTAVTLPARVRSAIILTVGSLFDDTKRGELIAALSGSTLDNPIVAMLYRLRKPTVA